MGRINYQVGRLTMTLREALIVFGTMILVGVATILIFSYFELAAIEQQIKAIERKLP